jgi:D-alanyl-D-alanine carboxypeptidase
MKIKKLRIKRILLALIILIIIIIGIISLINTIKYRKSNEYKLLKVGYNESEAEKIEKTLSTSEIEKVLTLNYNKNLVKFINKKNFIFSNLEEYLNYYKEKNSETYENVISIVNVNADEEWYKNIRNTDIKKDKLMLVNRYYALGADYVPEDLALISNRYAYNGNYISESILDSLVDLINAAKVEGYTLVVSQGYRSYADQASAYDSYEKYHTTEEADAYAARAGHSEYQTGLSILIKPYNKVIADPKTAPEYQWLLENAHDYGFILRYPEGKEKITGFTFEPWRYRYVGIDVANKIYQEDITLDEYYAFYID